MIKVLFDHQKFTTQVYGGISRYFYTIIDALKDNRDFDFELGVLCSNNHYLRSDSNLKSKLHTLYLPDRIYNKMVYDVNQWYSRRLLKKDNFDLFHPTYYDPYFLDNLRKPLVITIHDMTYERLPEYFWVHDPLTYQKRLNIERADKIIAISQTTKNDLIKYSGIDPSKVEVIYHGIDIHSPLKTKACPGLPEKYLLFVGDRSAYKNFYLLLDAFKEVSEEQSDLYMVLTGGGKPGIAEQESIRRLGLEKRIIHLNVTDEELNYLYKNARLFVYPSLYEGFGLPILEAFKASCPVLLSDTECFKEVAGSAVSYFSATNRTDLAKKIKFIIQDDDYRQHLTELGRERLNDYPLEKTIKETLDFYKSMV